MRTLAAALAVFFALVLFADSADSRGRSSGGRHYYGGGKHTHSHGGTYKGGRGSSHKGGHYQNPRTGNHYGRHK